MGKVRNVVFEILIILNWNEMSLLHDLLQTCLSVLLYVQS